MKDKDKLTTHNLPSNVAGEIVVPVTKRIVPNVDGTSVVEASLNLQNAPVPDRRYVADCAWAAQRGDSVRLFFGQYNLAETGLNSLVSLRVYPEAFRQFMKNSEKFLESMTTFLQRNDITLVTTEPTQEEPKQTVSLVTNLIAASFAGRESVLDFYHVSPAAIMKLAQRSDVVLDPVVRVDLGTSLLGGLIGSFRRISDSLPPEAK